MRSVSRRPCVVIYRLNISQVALCLQSIAPKLMFKVHLVVFSVLFLIRFGHPCKLQVSGFLCIKYHQWDTVRLTRNYTQYTSRGQHTSFLTHFLPSQVRAVACVHLSSLGAAWNTDRSRPWGYSCQPGCVRSKRAPLGISMVWCLGFHDLQMHNSAMWSCPFLPWRFAWNV